MIEEVNRKPPAERSVSELVTDMTHEVGRLARDEIRLAAAELRDDRKRLGLGAGLLGAAGVCALLGGGALVATAILALALVLHPWLAALLVAAVLFGAAGLAALVGRKEVRPAVPPVPNEAIAGVREDIHTVRENARS
ncbi:MAG TPA: phage holin family protein [Amycolatopsis sp.]|nr:phage holin family protein [Amycolatopsis sp.]